MMEERAVIRSCPPRFTSADERTRSDGPHEVDMLQIPL